MRLSQKEKEALFEEARGVFGYYLANQDNCGLGIEHPEQILMPPVRETSDGKYQIVRCEGGPYDFRINMGKPSGMRYIKIFKTNQRNFNSDVAVRKRYSWFWTKYYWIMQELTETGGSWQLIVKTPKGWADCIIPLRPDDFDYIDEVDELTKMTKEIKREINLNQGLINDLNSILPSKSYPTKFPVKAIEEAKEKFPYLKQL